MMRGTPGFPVCLDCAKKEQLQVIQRMMEERSSQGEQEA